MTRQWPRVKRSLAVIGVGADVAVVSLLGSSAAQANTVMNGSLNLRTATSFAVIGAATVTNTGSSVITGDVGVSPGTSMTGFPPGTVLGAAHVADAVASPAQSDTTTAFNVAASLTPQTSGLADLSGLTLSPGVYAGGALSITGNLTLAGGPTSVWVFQVASTLITGSGSQVLLTGGASACNVSWEVGSSTTPGSGSTFVGTVLAK